MCAIRNRLVVGCHIRVCVDVLDVSCLTRGVVACPLYYIVVWFPALPLPPFFRKPYVWRDGENACDGGYACFIVFGLALAGVYFYCALFSGYLGHKPLGFCVG